MSVPSILDEMKKTFTQRQETYGRSYVRFGHIAAALWPDGLAVTSPEDFARLGVVVQIISKLARYTNIAKGHKDSAHDLAIYGAILESLTNELEPEDDL